MPNRARQRGDYFERQTRAALEAAGWVVVRSAGSLGPADLVALQSGHTPLLISCKLGGYVPPEQRRQLADSGKAAGAWGVKAWRERPGWVALMIVTRHGYARLPDVKVPTRKPSSKATADGLFPKGEQLALPYG